MLQKSVIGTFPISRGFTLISFFFFGFRLLRVSDPGTQVPSTDQLLPNEANEENIMFRMGCRGDVTRRPRDKGIRIDEAVESPRERSVDLGRGS